VSRPATAAPAGTPDAPKEQHRSARWPAALSVTLAATALGCVTTFPMVLHLDSSIYGTPGDSTGAISFFWWWAYAIQHGKPLLDNSMWGAPFGADWSRQPFAVLPIVIFTPLSLLFGPTVAFNLGVLSSFPLSALFMYLLARRMQAGTLGATFAGLAFAFLPYHQMKATGHMFQAHMELFPALLWLLVRWRQDGSRWNLVGAGVVLGLTTWIDYYFAFIMLFLAAAFFVVNFAMPRLPGVPVVARIREHAVGVLVTGAAVLPFLPPAILLAIRPGANASQLSIVQRGLNDIDIYSVRPWEYLMPWSENPLVPAAIRSFQLQHLHFSNVVEQAQTLGYTVMALALVALFTFRPRFPVILGVAIAIAGAWLALPAHVHVLGVTVPGPATVLNHVVPFVRVYARFGVLVMTAATLLGGLGLTVIASRLRTPRLRWLLVVPFVLVALEFNRIPPTYTTTLFPAPQEYRWLADQPAGILVEYPIISTDIEEEILGRQYTLYQQVHLHPLLNGANPGSEADRVSRTLEPYYAPGVVDHLRSLGIRYVFVHRDIYQAHGFGLPRFVSGLQYVGTFDGGGVDAFRVSDAGAS
jgi:hypothetical protein